MVIINSFEECKSFEGKIIGVSEWHKIDQQQINKFAVDTLDQLSSFRSSNKSESRKLPRYSSPSSSSPSIIFL